MCLNYILGIPKVKCISFSVKIVLMSWLGSWYKHIHPRSGVNMLLRHWTQYFHPQENLEILNEMIYYQILLDCSSMNINICPVFHSSLNICVSARVCFYMYNCLHSCLVHPFSLYNRSRNIVFVYHSCYIWFSWIGVWDYLDIQFGHWHWNITKKRFILLYIFSMQYMCISFYITTCYCLLTVLTYWKKLCPLRLRKKEEKKE